MTDTQTNQQARDNDFAWVVPRHATDEMMSAGLYHCSADMRWEDLFTAWHYMVDQAQLDDRLAALSTTSEDYTRERIGELIAEGDGDWVACSGCQEGVDGCVSWRDYPYSDVFRCQPGSGCRECGGIGVIWRDKSYYEMWEQSEPKTSEGGAVKALREVVAQAYIDGATEVHTFWKECRPDVMFNVEPDFAEAASDYAADYSPLASARGAEA